MTDNLQVPLLPLSAPGLCLTPHPCKALNPSMAVEQPPGLVAGTPAMAQTASPLQLSLTPGDNTLMVSWDPPAGYVNSQNIAYDIQYSNDSGSTWNSWSISADSQHLLHITITGLHNGTTYDVRVRAQNHQGDGPWSASAVDQPVGTPAAPARPTLTPGNKDLHVGWDAPGDNGGTPISSYDIQYSSDNGSTWNEWDVSIKVIVAPLGGHGICHYR